MDTEKKTEKNVVISYGICHKCNTIIKEPDKPVEYDGYPHHEKCVPSKKEEQVKNKSYT